MYPDDKDEVVQIYLDDIIPIDFNLVKCLMKKH